MIKVKTFVLSTVAALLIGFIFIGSSSNTQVEPPQKNKKVNSSYSINAIDIPEKVSFAGEPMPLENFDTRESFDRELLINTYWQSQTVLFLKRAHKFFPVIEPILKAHGVPDDFKYLALAESGLMNITSPAGAKGYWQILKGTAGDYGLEVNKEIDERYHLEKSTEAAAKFLLESYEKFGSWTLAAASYNMGRRNVSKQVARQKSKNYYDLLLGEETGRYVYRIAAIKTIIENPNDYGFYVNKNQFYKYPKHTLIEVDSTIRSLPDFAHSLGINYKTLKALNPWLRENTLSNPNKKTYTIQIANQKDRAILPNPEFFPQDSVGAIK